jgi:tetratricopeptide (TPR) repeat protein
MPDAEKKAPFVGRRSELAILTSSVESAAGGKGSTTLLLGEPGVGKSRLVSEFRKSINEKEQSLLCASAEPDTVQPFMLFSKALEGMLASPLFQEEEYTQFYHVFAVTNTGMLAAKSSSEAEELDADIFAGMLSAVQSFVKDSFDGKGQQSSGLGRLEYGDMKILIEHGQHLFLTAVLKGQEHRDMKATVSRTIRDIEEKHGKTLAGWSGRMEEMSQIQGEIEQLARRRFLVKKDLEGVKLENERFRIAEHVASEIFAKAKEKPVTFLLEDLHWADESSLFVLAYLARNIALERVLILGTARPDEGAHFRKTREALRAEEKVREMELSGLEEADIFALLGASFAPNDFPEVFSERLARDSKGNPLFITETLKQMVAEASIVKERGAYILAREDYQFPKSVEEIVKRRLDMIEPDAMTAIEYASCIGVEFSIEDAKSLPLLSEPGPAFEKLSQAGIIQIANEKAKFSHAMFQHITYQSISGRWKTLYHKSLGEHYERAYSKNPDEVIYELARHFSSCGENYKAFEYCLKAGEKAEASYAVELAMQFYKNALNIMPHLKGGTSSKEVEANILGRLADSERQLGLMPEALGHYNKLLPMVEQSVDEYMSALIKIDTSFAIINEGDKGLEYLEKGLHLVQKTSPGIAAQLVSRIALVRSYKNEKEAAKHLVKNALVLLGEVKNPGTRSGVLAILGKAYDRLGDSEACIRMLRSSVEEAEKSGNMKDLASAYEEIGLYMHFRGEHLAAAKLLEKSVSYWERLGDITNLASNLVSLGMAYSDCGELEKSLACLKRALPINRKIGANLGLASILGNIGYTLAMMGRHGEALEYQEESLQLRKKHNSPGGMGWAYYDISLVHNQTGELEKAMDCLDKASVLFTQAGDELGLLFSKIAIAALFKFNGEHDKAAGLYLDVLKTAREKKALLEQYNAIKSLVELGKLELKTTLAELNELACKIDNVYSHVSLLELQAKEAMKSDTTQAEKFIKEGFELEKRYKGVEAEMMSASLTLTRARLHRARGEKEKAIADSKEAEQKFVFRGRLREAREAREYVESLAR